MTLKNRFLLVFFSIITLGIYPYYIFKISKNKMTNQNGELKTSSKINIDLNNLIAHLGGIDNINNIQATYTRLRIDFNTRSNVNPEAIKKLKNINGMFLSSTNVNLLVGNSAKAIASKLNEIKINHS